MDRAGAPWRLLRGTRHHRSVEMATLNPETRIADGQPVDPETRTADGRPVRNTLLLRIPDEEFRSLDPHLKSVSLENAVCLEQEGGRIESVYFLNGGIGSMVVETRGGKSVEVGVVGREDMIGLPLAAGLDEFTHSVVVQVPGDGFRVEASAMREALGSSPELNRLLLRRLAIRSVELAQNAACNRLHDAKQRLARWLLLIHDRLDSDVIHTTHDFLSKMVGTNRPTVTLAVRDLERDGIIERSRASISIKDRGKLEQQSCECYRLFRTFNSERGLRA